MLIKILKLIQILTDWFNLGCTKLQYYVFVKIIFSKLQFFLEINSLGGAFFDKAAFFLWQECESQAIIMKYHG